MSVEHGINFLTYFWSFSGNEKLLRCDRNPRDGLWNKLLDFYKDNNCLVDTDRFPVRSSELEHRKTKMSTWVPMDEYGRRGPVLPNPDKAVLPPRFDRKLGGSSARRRNDSNG